MTDSPHRTSPDEAGVPSGRGPGMPMWVKVFLIIAILLVLAFIVGQLVGVAHGPGLHSLPGDPGGEPGSVQRQAVPR